MSWIILSFLAPLAWATSNVGDKYIFGKWLKYSTAALFGFGLVGAFIALVVFGFRGFGNLPVGLVLGALCSGALYMCANFFYYRAVQLGEVSRVIPIIYLEPLFTACVSALILGEIFSPLKYLAVVLIVAGGIIVSYENGPIFKFSRAAKIAAVAALLFSLNSVLTKFLVDRGDYWTIFAYVRAGSFLSLIPVCFFQKKAFKELLSLKPLAFGAVALNNSIALLGSLLFTIAASLGYITLTNALSSVQPFFVLMITLGVGIFYPHILKEGKGRGVFLQKLFAIGLMFIGVLIVTR